MTIAKTYDKLNRLAGMISTPSGRWLSRDPIEEQGGLNLYAFVNNDPVNRWDVLGLQWYKVGTDDPRIPTDEGMGEWASLESSYAEIYHLLNLRSFIRSAISEVDGYPDAVAHMRHYLDGSGKDYTIRFQKLLDDDDRAKHAFWLDRREAFKFAESLPNKTGCINIVATSPTGVTADDRNWYYAVGSFYMWGKGLVCVCGDDYSLEFEYKFSDRYNWNPGQTARIPLLGDVPDEYMGMFHLMGLARDFNMVGAIKKTYKWKKGSIPKIRDLDRRK
ncbi:MAG: RHS repeat-associated core domain-containing protein [Limisphaerales bacterium]|jgi:hypothetical protein